MGNFRLCLLISFFTNCSLIQAQQITVAGQPAQLDIRRAGEHSIRITLKPQGFKEDFPATPALADRPYSDPVISLLRLDHPVKKAVGNLIVEVKQNPLNIIVTNQQAQPVQDFVFNEDGTLSFKINDDPVLGMGEGGSKPDSGINWRDLPVEYDRRGRYDKMQPRWQADAYGSRNPVAMLIGTNGWATFMVSPWIEVDLRNKDRGIFIPWKSTGKEIVPQTEKNQQLNEGKGIPPVEKMAPGLFDFFVFDAHDPSHLMKDFSVVTGPAAMPPKWSLGYMQSHRRLEDDKQMLGIVDTFRAKKFRLMPLSTWEPALHHAAGTSDSRLSNLTLKFSSVIRQRLLLTCMTVMSK